jgi:hypothetical protein
MRGRAWGAVAAAVMATMAVGAQASAEPRGRGCGHGHGPAGGCGRWHQAAPAGTLAPMGATVQSAVETALADERRTQAVYAAVVASHPDVRPFSNAVLAEARHAAHLETTLTARGLAVPARPPLPAVPGGTVAEACAAAVEGERANVALYDRLLAAGGLPDDVAGAFARNRRASLEHHLPAFEGCVARSGGAR